MEVILLERIEKLGHMGEIVRVKDGYARNFLLPQKKALRATDENKAHFEAERDALQKVNDDRRAAAESDAAKVEGKDFVLIRQAGDTLQLFGSVTARDIAGAITDAGVEVKRQQVRLDQPIKTLGLHDVHVVLHPEVIVTVKANVARSEEEAEIQAKGGTIAAPGEEPEAEAGAGEIDADVFESEELAARAAADVEESEEAAAEAAAADEASVEAAKAAAAAAEAAAEEETEGEGESPAADEGEAESEN